VPVFILLIVVLSAPGHAQSAKASDALGVTALVGAEVRVRKDYTISVNGREIAPDVPPVEGGRTIFVPIRFIAQALGAEVSWDQVFQTVSIRLGSRSITLTVNNPEATVDGRSRRLAFPPFIFRERTMLPLRPVAESLGSQVRETPRSMIIRTPTSSPEDASASLSSQVQEASHPMQTQIPEAPAPSSEGEIDQSWLRVPPLMIGIDVVGWGFALIALIWQIVAALKDGVRDLADKWVIGFILLVVAPATLRLESSYWTAAVPIGAALTGVMSREKYTDKLVTIANAAQGLGLMFTLIGLGLIIGPAIREHNVPKIGYGISVKIQATIVGLFISLVMNALVAQRSRSNA